MSLGQFPAPYNPLHTGDPAGPGPRGTSPCGFIMQQLPDEYPGLIEKVMLDGGATYGADTTNTIKRWQFTYTGLNQAQAAVLDTHRADAKGRLLGFSFRDWRTDTLYTDCHYESYEYPQHQNLDNQSRILTLIKRPV